MDSIECIVIGAGVVGLAVARALAQQGREVLVLEKADAIGTGISSRNSEVIHAGIYYPADSLKARFCVHGKALLYQYCQDFGVSYKNTGKWLVATTAEQVAQLGIIQQTASRNQVCDLRRLSLEEIKRGEPALFCLAALESPSTGIVDSHGLMLSLQGQLEHAGGMVVCNSEVLAIRYQEMPSGPQNFPWEIDTNDTTLKARVIINAAGLRAPELSKKIKALAPQFQPTQWYAKGNYFSLTGRAPFTRLIYPIPDPASHLAGLGVHLTLDLGGQAKFGPDVEWLERLDAPMAWQVNEEREAQFTDAIRRYWPDLPNASLQPGYVGIRPKLSGPGQTAADFRIDGPQEHGLAGLVNLLGIESPGLTSCLAIAEHVTKITDTQS